MLWGAGAGAWQRMTGPRMGRRGGSAPGRGNTAIVGSGSGCVALDKKLKLPNLLLTYK